MTKIHKSWLVLIALCGLAAASIGISINTSGVFYSVVSEDLGIFRGAFAFNMTIFSLVNAIAGLFVVRLFDRFPFKLVLTASVILATLSTGLKPALAILLVRSPTRNLDRDVLNHDPNVNH